MPATHFPCRKIVGIIAVHQLKCPKIENIKILHLKKFQLEIYFTKSLRPCHIGAFRTMDYEKYVYILFLKVKC